MKRSHTSCLVVAVILSLTLGLTDFAAAQDAEYHEIGLFFAVNDPGAPPNLLADDSIGLLVSNKSPGSVGYYLLASDPAFGGWAGKTLIVGIASALHVKKGQRIGAMVAAPTSGGIPGGMWLATGNAQNRAIVEQRVVRVAVVSGSVVPSQAGAYWFVMVRGVFRR